MNAAVMAVAPHIAGQSEPDLSTDPSPTPEIVVTGPSDSGFGWGEAVIGASVTLAVVLIAGAIVLLVRSRRPRSGRFHPP